MSERELPVSGVLEAQGGADAPTTAGQQLRQAREAAGLHVAALAGALKVPVHKLEALEADDYAAFSDFVFMRGVASSICRTLGLDPQPVLDKLPRSTPKGFDAQRVHLNAPIKARAGRNAGMSAGGGVSRKAVGAVIVLLVAAAAVYFLPSGMFDRDSAGDGTPTTVSQPVQAVPAAPAPAPAAPAFDTPAAALPAAPFAQTPAAAALPVAPTDAPAAASVPAAAETPALPGQASLAFSATATSWVQVKDARGAVVLSKTLNAGESAQVSAQLPVQVVVGRVDATTLQVRGQAFDLVAAAQGKNVARFEVK